jgi:hypothetical protein
VAVPVKTPGGEIPATVVTVANRFALLESGAPHLRRAFESLRRTGPPTVGTGLLLARAAGLPLGESLRGPLGESGGGVSDLLRGMEIDAESGSVAAEGVPRANFAPPGSASAGLAEGLGGEGAVCHDAPCVRAGARTTEKGSLSIERGT